MLLRGYQCTNILKAAKCGWSRQPAGWRAHLVVVRDVNGFVGRRPEHTGLPNGGDFLGGQQGKYWPLAHIHHDAAVCHDASTSKRTLLEQINQTNKQQKAYQKEYDVFSLADNNVNTFTWKKKDLEF